MAETSILYYRFVRVQKCWKIDDFEPIALTNNRTAVRNNVGYRFNEHQTELELSFAVSNRSYVTVPSQFKLEFLFLI